MIFKYLFWVEENNIKTYHHRDNEFEVVKYKGDDIYKGDINLFWNWWENKSSYIKEFDTIDFCFLNLDGKNYNLSFNSDNYIIEKNTTWDENQVRQFINLYTNISIDKLVDPSLKNIEIDEESIIISLFPSENIISENIKKEDTEPIDYTSIEEGIIAKYYRSKTMEIKNSLDK